MAKIVDKEKNMLGQFRTSQSTSQSQ